MYFYYRSVQTVIFVNTKRCATETEKKQEMLFQLRLVNNLYLKIHLSTSPFFSKPLEVLIDIQSLQLTLKKNNRPLTLE